MNKLKMMMKIIVRLAIELWFKFKDKERKGLMIINVKIGERMIKFNINSQ